MILRMTYYIIKSEGFNDFHSCIKKSLSKRVLVNIIDCIIMIDG